MTLKECMTLKEIFPTTIFSVKLMHDCICVSVVGVVRVHGVVGVIGVA